MGDKNGCKRIYVNVPEEIVNLMDKIVEISPLFDDRNALVNYLILGTLKVDLIIFDKNYYREVRDALQKILSNY